ncbi:MAG: UPF0758 domain-containing protein [bacterium]
MLRRDAVGLAREMLTEFDGFRGLMSATYEDLLKIKGIGNAKIAQILGRGGDKPFDFN